jgi:hypothetical protein
LGLRWGTLRRSFVTSSRHWSGELSAGQKIGGYHRRQAPEAVTAAGRFCGGSYSHPFLTE